MRVCLLSILLFCMPLVASAAVAHDQQINSYKPLPPEVARVQAKAKNKKLIIISAPLKAAAVTVLFPHPGNGIAPLALMDRTTVVAGSLKNNIQRIAKQFGWSNIVWSAPYDFRWVGATRVHARSLQGLLTLLLKNYPLQAVFFQGNHVLEIIPRTLR